MCLENLRLLAAVFVAAAVVVLVFPKYSTLPSFDNQLQEVLQSRVISNTIHSNQSAPLFAEDGLNQKPVSF